MIGNGHYGFIPDGGMVGTAFVNALGNILSTSVQDAMLTVTAENDARYIITFVTGTPPHYIDNTSSFTVGSWLLWVVCLISSRIPASLSD